MPQMSFDEFVSASDFLPVPERSARGGLKFMKLSPNGVSISASLKNSMPSSVDVLVHPSDNTVLLIREGSTYEIGKYGNTWMLMKSSTLMRQLEAAGWDKTMRNEAEEVDGGILVKSAAAAPTVTKRTRKTKAAEPAQEAVAA